MKILVTGATGFIGQHVISSLLDNEQTIIATSTSEEKAKKFDWYNKVEYLELDYYNQNFDYYNYFKKPDVLVHLAWKGLPNYKEPFHFEKNLPVECRFLKNFVDHNIRKLVVAGTCLEYGIQNGCISEDSMTFPITQYALAKDSLRKYLELILKDFATSFNWVRFFYLYGNAQNPKSLLSQLKKAICDGDTVFNMSDGEQLRDYLSVEDVASYVCTIALQDRVNGIVNCCSGKPISVRRLVEENVKELKSDIKLNLGYYSYLEYEPMAFWGDTTKLRKIIGEI